MYCPKCGEKNPDDAKFCGSCGAPLPASGDSKVTPASGHTAPATGHAAPTSGQAAARPAAGRATSETSPAVRTELKVGIIIGSLLIPLLGIVMGIIYILDANPEKKATGRLWLLVGSGLTIIYCLYTYSISY